MSQPHDSRTMRAADSVSTVVSGTASPRIFARMSRPASAPTSSKLWSTVESVGVLNAPAAMLSKRHDREVARNHQTRVGQGLHHPDRVPVSGDHQSRWAVRRVEKVPRGHDAASLAIFGCGEHVSRGPAVRPWASSTCLVRGEAVADVLLGEVADKPDPCVAVRR